MSNGVQINDTRIFILFADALHIFFLVDIQFVQFVKCATDLTKHQVGPELKTAVIHCHKSRGLVLGPINSNFLAIPHVESTVPWTEII